MAPTIRNHLVGYLPSGGTVRSVTLPTYSPGDGLYIAMVDDLTSQTFTVPDGWTRVVDSAPIFTTSNTATFLLLRKTAGASEPSPVSITVGTTERAVWIAFSVQDDNGISVAPVANTGATSASAQIPAITTTANNSLVIGVIGTDGESLPHGTATGYSKLDEISYTSAGSMSVHYQAVASAGVVSAQTVTITSEQWRGWAFAIGPTSTPNVSPTGIATGAPVLGTPTIEQTHALAPSGIATGAVELGTPTVTETNALAPTGITTGAPALGTPTVTETNALTPIGLSTGAVEPGTPTIEQTHALTPTGIATGAVELGAPTVTVSETAEVTPLGIATGAVELGTPTIEQTHALTPIGLSTGAVELGAPLVLQEGDLAPVGIVTGAPELGTPTIAQEHQLAPADLLFGPYAFGAPTVTPIYALAPLGIATGAPVLGMPTMGQTHTLTPMGLFTGAVELGAPIVAIDIATPTPISRVYVIQPERRVFTVNRESRIYRIGV